MNLINSNSCKVPLDTLDHFNQAQLKIELTTELGRIKTVAYLKKIIQNKFSNE